MNKISIQKINWLIVLSICGLLYFSFKLIRIQLFSCFFKDSFPSFLVPLIMFSIIELVPGISFNSYTIKVLILILVTIISSVWLEFIVPLFYSISITDYGDVFAMFVGLCFYFFIEYSLSKHTRKIYNKKSREIIYS